MKSEKFNLEKLIRANIKDLKPYSSARDEYKELDKDMIFIDANESPFDNGINRYPDPQQQLLKRQISEIKGLSANQLLLGNGSDEVLDLLFRAFCEPGVNNIITMPPTYGMYDVLAKINNVANREVLLNADFQPDLQQLWSRVDENTRMIFICSPNNPTGNLIDRKAITAILNTFSGLVVIDEAYIDFTADQSWLTALPNYENLVVTQTMSKAFGMAGIRLGLVFASGSIIRILNKIKPPYNINTLTQQKALELLRNIDIIYTRTNAIIENKTLLLKELLQVNFVRKIYPSDANFLLVQVDDANKRYTQLLAEGIVVRNRSAQPGCENTLRFTVGTDSENIKLIKALKKISKA